MKYKNLSLSAYAFGYGCGFVKDSRENAFGVQNITLEKLNEIAIGFELGGVEIPVDKYFRGQSHEAFASYITNLNNKGLRLIHALEKFEHSFFSKIAPLIRNNQGNFVRAKISNFYGGNRFKEKIYRSDIEVFRNEIKKSLDVIDEYGIKVLIENHQDVTLADIFSLIDEFGVERIGVNWDTGNSFPTGETVESFLKKAGELIGNVHLKDYRIQSTQDGYIMHRCALGKGVVDFDYLIKMLYAQNKDMPFTIELGAMNGREAFINNELYWLHTKGVSENERNALTSFINSKVENNVVISTLWERKGEPSEILKDEYAEVVESIEFISNILKKTA
uniref:sugar phosphate isomerase/epimerase family protein n=1 Tax=Algoriphagus sp. TaxID=1872435 RepID=UPI0040482305